MKKPIKLFLTVAILLLIVGCTKKDETMKRRNISKKIDTELVQKISGGWLGQGEKESNVYDISYDGAALKINGDELEITETDNNWVKSQTKKGKLFFYDFELKEDEVIVFPSFPVEKGKIGGVLAPINLKSIDSKEISVHSSNKEEMKTYEEEMKKSFSMYEEKIPFLLKLIRFTHEGDPIMETISYNGKTLHYHYDNSEDKLGEKAIINTEYKELKYEEINNKKKQNILFNPVSDESQKEVVFDVEKAD